MNLTIQHVNIQTYELIYYTSSSNSYNFNDSNYNKKQKKLLVLHIKVEDI